MPQAEGDVQSRDGDGGMVTGAGAVHSLWGLHPAIARAPSPPLAAVKFTVVYQSSMLEGLFLSAQKDVRPRRVASVVTASKDTVHPTLPLLGTVASS